jgi:hypothetical protein
LRSRTSLLISLYFACTLFGGDLCLELVLKLPSLPGNLVKHDPGRRTEIQAFDNSEHRNVHA